MGFNRISARRGSIVNLNARFLHNGQLVDPFAIYRVEIYHTEAKADNIIYAINLPSLESDYPSSIVREGTGPGLFSLPWAVPNDLSVPDVCFDVWYWYASDPQIVTGSGTDTNLADYTSQLLSQRNCFWVYPDDWYLDGGLETIAFKFESTSNKFNKPGQHHVEVNLIPLPLYNYDYNFVTPLLPYLSPKISIWTEYNELILADQDMEFKIRMGSYRYNPFVVSYLLNSSEYQIGTYKYRIMLTLPDHSTRSSPDLYFTVS